MISFEIIVIFVIAQIAGEELFDLLQRFVFRLRHARVQVQGADHRYRPVDDEHPGQGEPRDHGQKPFGAQKVHQKRHGSRDSAYNTATPKNNISYGQ